MSECRYRVTLALAHFSIDAPVRQPYSCLGNFWNTDMASPISQLDDLLGYWMRFVSNHVSHAFRLKIESRGVTVAEWVVMRALFDQEPANPSQLAERIGLTRGAVSKLVDRLVTKELIA